MYTLSLMQKIIKLVQKASTPEKKPVLERKHKTTERKDGSLHFLITCQSGLESLVKRDCEKLRLEDIHAQDRLVKCSGTQKNLYELLVWSRFANRVYLSLAEESITDFERLFAVCADIDWGAYLTGRERIIIEASSTRSTLSSVPTIQSIAQKAIYGTMNTPNTTSGVEVHILILIIDDIAHILLDVTGEPLHKRGYRIEAGEAPIKENLAAAIVAWSNWKYSTPLIDPFCGSGTIPIEAAMIARNIAPGLMRHFRIESLISHNKELLTEVKTEAKAKSYPSGKYTIIGRDIEPEMIRIAHGNAMRAGVQDDIVFEVGNYTESSITDKTIVTNPPYGNRLQWVDLGDIYDKLKREIEWGAGGFITSYDIGKNQLANKKVLNGAEECRYWYKKN